MHILTKFFVVVAAVLSLLLSALTISYSVNAQRITREFQSVRQEADAASLALNLQVQSHSDEIASLRRELESRDLMIAQFRSDSGAQEIENQNLVTQVREAEAESKAIEGRIAQLGVTAETLTSLVSNYRDEVRTLRDSELRNRDQRLDLEDRIADLESENQVFDDTIRALREQLTEARRAVASNGGSVGPASPANGSAAASQALRVLSGPPVFGRVSTTRRDPATGESLVEVSLGTNDGVSENTELYVVRGSQYVGALVVQTADLQSSVARVRLTNGDLRVRNGDEVRTRILASN